MAAGNYWYYVATGNERGESPACVPVQITGVTADYKVTVTINHPTAGVFRFFNVYRSAVGGTAHSAKFIGRVVPVVGAASTDFVDLNNKVPGFVTGVLLEKNGAEIRQLAAYSRLKLAVSDLSIPEAHFRFLGLAVVTPRKYVLVDNLKGTL
jgi:hypothetical protein